MCFCKIPLVTEKGHTLFRSYYGFSFSLESSRACQPFQKKGRQRKSSSKEADLGGKYLPALLQASYEFWLRVGVLHFLIYTQTCVFCVGGGRISYTKMVNLLDTTGRGALESRRHQSLGHKVSADLGKVLIQRQERRTVRSHLFKAVG